MMQNRLLRFVQRPAGIYHFSVFHQFAGGLGPSCVACGPDGRIYVGTYDVGGGAICIKLNRYSSNTRLVHKFLASDANGRIYILAPSGAIEHVLEVPGQEITGICIEYENKPDCVFMWQRMNILVIRASTRALFVTEASGNSLHCIALDAIFR